MYLFLLLVNTPREKPQEIKTVRIVKRESERRQRDRDKCGGNIGLPLTSVSVKCVPVIEEPDYRVRTFLLKLIFLCSYKYLYLLQLFSIFFFFLYI